jgi:hypothetical protein
MVISILVVLHFGGILTAVLSVPPPGAPPLWLATQVWTRFYRPYLQFMYLNNAYHFYSPEPGPATLLWFRVEYEDGSSCWVKVPDRKKDPRDPLLLEYYRRLPIAQNVQQLAIVASVPQELTRRRATAGLVQGIPSAEEIALYLPGVPQYQPPAGNARPFLASYARFVAGTYLHKDPAVGVLGVKVYRVVHVIIDPGRFARGTDPSDPSLFLPYFQGEFTADGKLKDPGDPFLYWLIPIVAVPDRELAAGSSTPLDRPNHQEQPAIVDYLQLHAGSSPWEASQ